MNYSSLREGTVTKKTWLIPAIYVIAACGVVLGIVIVAWFAISTGSSSFSESQWKIADSARRGRMLIDLLQCEGSIPFLTTHGAIEPPPPLAGLTASKVEELLGEPDFDWRDQGSLARMRLRMADGSGVTISRFFKFNIGNLSSFQFPSYSNSLVICFDDSETVVAAYVTD